MTTKQILDDLYGDLRQYTRDYLGFPTAKGFDYSELVRFLEFPMNNVGDPFTTAQYKVNSRKLECEVIADIAELVRAPKGRFK